MKKIVASGPIIIEKRRILLTKDNKDDFYKIPGGTVHQGEGLEETCLRELTEETGFEGKIVRKLSTLILNKNPRTKEKMKIELNHYECELVNSPASYKSFDYNGHDVRWIAIKKLLGGRYSVAPNIKFLIEKGDIK